MTANIYENTASLYDVGNDRSLVATDLQFYIAEIPPNASVLEVGCGTGRVSLVLAKRGNSVTGIDLSQAMLDVFNRKMVQIPALTGGVSLHCMDMRSFNLERNFDWIIFPFRVFQALISDRDRKACLSVVKRHMSGNSRAILTLFNPMKSVLNGWGRKNILDFERIDEATGRTIKRYQDQMRHDGDAQVITARMRYEVYANGALVETLFDELELGYLYPDQCDRLFAESGMTVVSAYSSYDRQPLRENDQKEQIYILGKTDFE